MTMLDLSQRVAIITGAADDLGQGAASAKLLADLGAAVVLADIDENGAQARAEEIRRDGHDAIAIRADVRDEQQVAELVRGAVAEFGRLDILHSQAANLAVLADPGDPAMADVTVEGWREQFETIVLGTMLTCKHAIPAMIEAGGGSIICTSSVTGMVGELNLSVYAAAKAAVNQVVRSIATQYGKQGIRANAVAPGLVLSRPGLAMGERLIALYAKHSSTPSVGQPVDIANLVAFLASDEARFITGEVIRADGGWSGHSPLVADQRDSGMMLGTTS